MTIEIKKFLDGLPSEFNAVKDQAIKYYNFDDKASTRKDGAIRIFNRTWVAPLNYGLVLFPPVEDKVLEKYKEKNKAEIPDLYKDVLHVMNGCIIYDLNLYGLPRSIYDKGLLDRSDMFQFDLGIANSDWKFNYDIGQDLFHFGGRSYTFDENIGYFLDRDNKINSIRTSGEIVNTWTSFSQFMMDEVKEAERIMLDEFPKALKGINCAQQNV